MPIVAWALHMVLSRSIPAVFLTFLAMMQAVYSRSCPSQNRMMLQLKDEAVEIH